MFPFVYRVNLAGFTHLWIYGVGIPLAVVLARRKVVGTPGGPLPNRLRHYKHTTFELAYLAVGSLAVAWAQHMQLFPHAFPAWRGVVAGVAAYVIAVLYMRPRWRRAVQRNVRVVHLFMPSNGVERAWWLAVSVLAGVGEEITWRGVQTGLLAALTGSYLVGGLLSAVSFGGAHMTQGWRSAAIIVLFALAFQSVVWLTGSLYVAMAVHIVYDITAGLTYGRLGRELGYAPQAAGPAGGAPPNPLN